MGNTEHYEGRLGEICDTLVIFSSLGTVVTCDSNTVDIAGDRRYGSWQK